jgi:FkbM family methyltransferase
LRFAHIGKDAGMNFLERLHVLHRVWRFRFRVERDEVSFVMKNLAPGQTAVDIGAYKGSYTYWMRKAVGREGRVFSFEPQPDIAEYLDRIKTAFEFSNVTVINRALSSQPGQLQLFRPDRIPSPSASLRCELHDRTAVVIPVLVDTLDRYFAECDGRPIHLIKCDVEGHELEVFQGARDVLTRDRPKLLFECEAQHRADGSVHTVFEYLHELGYQGFFFESGRAHHVSDFRPEIHQRADRRGYINNFAFMPGEQLDRSPISAGPCSWRARRNRKGVGNTRTKRAPERPAA